MRTRKPEGWSLFGLVGCVGRQLSVLSGCQVSNVVSYQQQPGSVIRVWASAPPPLSGVLVSGMQLVTGLVFGGLDCEW
jgi:hypothetical protein